MRFKPSELTADAAAWIERQFREQSEAERDAAARDEECRLLEQEQSDQELRRLAEYVAKWGGQNIPLTQIEELARFRRSPAGKQWEEDWRELQREHEARLRAEAEQHRRESERTVALEAARQARIRNDYPAEMPLRERVRAESKKSHRRGHALGELERTYRAREKAMSEALWTEFERERLAMAERFVREDLGR